ncbi:MAG: hypothetical protein AAGI23_06605 [Bacteroidota bacterium]
MRFPLVVSLCLCFSFFTSCEEETIDNPNLEQGFRVVRLVGTAVGEMRPVPDIDGDGQEDMGNCFDLTLVDAYTGKVLGKGTDCLSNVQQVGEGLAIVGTAFFEFDDGTVVTRGLTSVRPKTHGSPTVTHITGAIPTASSNDILSGTGQFEGVSGGVRLSGAVDMSKVESNNQITFNCVFVIPAKIDPNEVEENKMVLRLAGTAVGENRAVDGIEGGGNCFDVDVYDVMTGEKIGTGTDCLSNVNEVGEGLALTGTAIFNLPGGQIVSRALTSVQPKTHGSDGKTHITGSIPSKGDNDIVSGTGKYAEASGTVRLSGAVDMSNVASNNEITFDCLFLVELD